MNQPVIALTGGTGFIGRHLLRELPRHGYRLRVLLRRPATAPIACASAVIGDLARPQNMAAALAGADAVIHSAGIAPRMSGSPEVDHRVVNTEGTIALARAAQRAGVRRFVFLSSLRAQSGPASPHVLTEAMEPQPSDAYGKAKLAAERGLAGLDLDWVALRLPLTYGPGVQGNMARLMQIARSPFPLPVGGLKGKRSLLALDNLVAAILAVLAVPHALKRPLIVADPEPLALPDMIAAMRRGLGRRPGILPVPAPLVAATFRALGRPDVYDRFAGSLVARPAALLALGWEPRVTSAKGLERLMQSAPAE
jgi:nucleoside-diphosphate-sugar epimerase